LFDLRLLRLPVVLNFKVSLKICASVSGAAVALSQ